MFNRMLDHPLIDVLLSTDYRDIADEVEAAHMIYTGPIDEYFGFRFGQLPYRSLRFEHKIARSGAVPAGGGGQLSGPAGALHADHRI